MKFSDTEIERYRKNIIILDLLNALKTFTDRVTCVISLYSSEIISLKFMNECTTHKKWWQTSSF